MTSEKPIESVKCDVCDTIFTECFSASTNQAYGCASDFYQTNEKSYVLSSYGSKYDTTRFNVLPSSNLNGKYGVVCDECIKALIERKEISEDTAFNYWENLEKNLIPPEYLIPGKSI